jgi:hypothetical protein
MREETMKYLTLIILLLASCGGGGQGYQPIKYDAPVQQVTMKGDSRALGIDELGNQTPYWNQLGVPVENDGVSGATLDYLLLNPDHRSLQTVVLWAGFNNLKKGEDVPTVISKYQQYMNTLTFTKLICVQDPYESVVPNATIDAFNVQLAVICPHVVYAGDIPNSDGVHPTPAGYMTEGQRIGGFI